MPSPPDPKSDRLLGDEFSHNYNKENFDLNITEDDATALVWYRGAAAQGYARAEYLIGYMYEQGHGVKKSYADALRWYQVAAEHGSGTADNAIGYMYQEGRGVSKSYSQALTWFRKGVLLKNAVAAENIGYMYLDGKGVQKNYADAIKWFVKADEIGGRGAAADAFGYLEGHSDEVPAQYRAVVDAHSYGPAYPQTLQAAKQGDAMAEDRLAEMYEHASNDPHSEREVKSWYLASAKQGNADAEDSLALAYSTGMGVPKDSKLSNYWYEKAATAGNSDAAFQLCDTSNDRGRHWCERATALGVASAAADLGNYYDVVRHDGRQSAYWYTKAANQGNIAAIQFLGKAYYTGQGGPVDLEQAVHWYRVAAERGDPDSAFMLWFLYQNGKGVPKDDQAAMFWLTVATRFQDPGSLEHIGEDLTDGGNGLPVDDSGASAVLGAAAKGGNAKAMEELGQLYENGDGVAQSYAEADVLYNMAVAHGDTDAKYESGRVQTHLSASQLSSDQDVAEGWKVGEQLPNG